MNKTASWDIRPCTEKDISGIFSLAKFVFSRVTNSVPLTFSVDHLRWLFLDNPNGTFKGYVAHRGEKMLGFYGVIPTQLDVFGNKTVGSLSLLTVTHPDYWRQGILNTLASALYTQLEENGVVITYGFPNENSLPVLVNKLHWKHISTINLFARPLKASRIAHNYFSNAVLTSVVEQFGLLIYSSPVLPSAAFSIRPCLYFDARVNVLRAASRSDETIQIAHDQDFLNWRYASSPEWKYHIFVAEENNRMLGYIVMRFVEFYGLRGGMIMDIAALPERGDVLRGLLQYALVYADKKDQDLVAGMAYGNPALKWALLRAGFLAIPQAIAPKKWYFGGRLHKESDQNASGLLNARNWVLTFGDNDVM